MATLAELKEQLEIAFDADGFVIAPTPLRRTTKITRGLRYVSVAIAATAYLVASSNVTRQTADVVITFSHRALGSLVSDMATAEAVIVGYLADYTQITFWSDIVAVAQSPLPEIEVESEPERIGEVVEAQIRAQLVLEV